MNKEITDKLIEYMDSTKDWVLETAPEIFQQIVAYGFWSNLLNIISCLFVSFIFGSLFFRGIDLKQEEAETLHTGYFITMIIFAIISIVFLYFASCSVYSLLKIHVAPKLYIIDYLRGK